MLTGVAQAVGTAVLLVNALAPHPSVPVIYGVGVLMAVAQSLQSPSREALVPRTVRHAELPAAVALSSVGAQVGMLAGPALGGVLLASVGTPWAYGVTLVGFAGATALFGALRPYPPLEEPSAAGTVREIRERRGLRGAPARPARHLRRRHGRDVPGDAGGAVPRAGHGRARPAGAARAAVLGRDRRVAAGHGDERVDGPGAPPRARRGAVGRGVGGVGGAGRADDGAGAGAARASCWPGRST